MNATSTSLRNSAKAAAIEAIFKPNLKETLIILGFGLLTAIHTPSDHFDDFSMLFTGLLITSIAARLLTSLFWASTPQTTESCFRWAKFYSFSCLLTGLCWSVPFLYLADTAPPFSISILVFCTLSIFAVSRPTLNHYLPAFYAVCIPPMVAMLVRLLDFTNYDFGIELYAIALSLCIFVLIQSWQASQGILKSTIFQIENKSLIQELKAASKAKSDFLATMSHEIRTPMNGVLASTDLLLETQLSKEQKVLVKTMKESGETLLHVLNDILDFSKIEAGMLSLDTSSFSIKENIRKIIDLFSQKALDTNVKLSCSIPTDFEDQRLGDVVRFRQILMNLVSNAIKFSPNGKVEIILHSQHRKDPKLIEIDIIDTGIGMDTEQLKGLFTAFKQADTSITRLYGGTGLGLSICQRLCHLMGGEITVKSSPDQGSIFTIRLPLTPTLREELPNRAVEKQSSPTPCLENASSTFFRILVAEDDVTNRFILQKMIEKIGADAKFAEDGLQAYELYLSHPFDLILTDCHMPNCDGYELTQKIRLHKEAQNLPIIAITADAIEGTKEKCLNAGMTDYLTKPINFNKLKDTLHKYAPDPTFPCLPLPASKLKHNQPTDFNIQQICASLTQEPSPQKKLEEPENVLDLSSLEMLYDGINDEAKEVLYAFKNHTGLMLTDLLTACDHQDFEKARQLAHKLKGSSTSTGALELGHMLANLEEALETKESETILLAQQNLPQAYERVSQQIDRL